VFVVYPDGTQLYRDGRLVYPNGMQLLPDDTIRLPDGLVREISPNGTVTFSDGTVIHGHPPMAPPAFKIVWSTGVDVRKHYPHVNDAQLRAISEAMTTVVTNNPWGQLDEARRQDSSPVPETNPYGPR
jgi:hypothetical protein